MTVCQRCKNEDDHGPIRAYYPGVGELCKLCSARGGRVLKAWVDKGVTGEEALAIERLRAARAKWADQCNASEETMRNLELRIEDSAL